jgi:hypothetical protein
MTLVTRQRSTVKHVLTTWHQRVEIIAFYLQKKNTTPTDWEAMTTKPKETRSRPPFSPSRTHLDKAKRGDTGRESQPVGRTPTSRESR